MLKYAARKLLLALPLLFGVVTLVWLLVELSPGDAASKYLRPDLAPEMRDQIAEVFGLNDPAPTRYVKMLGNLIRFDFGVSFSQGEPVFDLIGDALPNTLLLSGITLLVMFPLGIALGTLQAMRQGSAVDTTASVASLTLYSMPEFWIGLMLQLMIALYWSDWLRDAHAAGWLSRASVDALTLPTLGVKDEVRQLFMSPFEQLVDRAKHLLLPAVAMGVASAAGIARYMRSSMLEIVRQDFVRTARAKGLSERKVMLYHGIRNALLPIVTLVGLTIPALFSGSLLVEIVFAWPGMGRLVYSAIMAQDTPLLIACFYVYTLVVVAGNLLADLVYAWIDPRIRLN